MPGSDDKSRDSDSGSGAVSDHRAGGDRRQATRRGRRGSDPKRRCPSCGLLVDTPHGLEAACVKALRAALERLIAGAPLDPDAE
jgi:hypothetical protein